MYLRDLDLPKPQMLRQRSECDCGVVDFGKLAGVDYEDVCLDLPEAHLGTVSVDGWMNWLENRGHHVVKQQGCPTDVMPCAHLVAPFDDRRYCHWVYRDADGDIHDPAPSFAFMPANDSRMRDLTCYECMVLTLSISAKPIRIL
jgi:hypothetical protein